SSLVAQVRDELVRMRDVFKGPAPDSMMQTIDSLTEKLGWDEAYREEWLANSNLIQSGEVANEYKAQAIILALQQRVRELEEEDSSQSSIEPDTEEIPF